MAFHESFWVVAGTSGPVLGLTLVAESVRAHRVLAAQLRDPPPAIVTVLLFLPIPIIAAELGALTFALQRTMNSLRTESDAASMPGITWVLLAGWGLLIALILLESITRLVELLSMRRRRPSPGPPR